MNVDKFLFGVEQQKAHGLTALSKTEDLTLEVSRKIFEEIF